MIELRDLQFLAALAQHRHFARAAQACGVSQPAFSTRIRKLEDRLGVALVRRDNRFQGLTEAGEKLVQGGVPLVEGMRALEHQIASAKSIASGRLRLGVIPTASTYAGSVAAALSAEYPEISVRIETGSSLAIQQRLIDGRLDAGVSYQEGADRDMLHVRALYQERYVLLCPTALAPRGTSTITWAEAAHLPLVLLDPGMQNRRIVDKVFEDVGVVPQIFAETNALTSGVVMASRGAAAVVIPQVMAEGLAADLRGTVLLEMIEPAVEKSIALLVPQLQKNEPLVAALIAVLDLPS